MLAQLRMELEAEGLNYKKASMLQGVLFEQLPTEYVEELHSQSMHPYSQSLSVEEGVPVWYVNTLNRKAYQEIIFHLLSDDFNEFYIRKENLTVRIKNKGLKTIVIKDLLKEFYEGVTPKTVRFRIITPMAFKQNGLYQTLPDIRCIFQNLMQKSSIASQQAQMSDEDALEQIVGNTYISRYRIQSASFPMEGVSLSGCVGEVTMGFRGTDMMKRYALFLLRFAEYSGIGVKTGMGMGAVQILDWRGKDE